MQHKIFARDTLGIYGFEVVRSAACSNDEFSLVEWTSFSGVTPGASGSLGRTSSGI
jgi:hypothetical protein